MRKIIVELDEQEAKQLIELLRVNIVERVYLPGNAFWRLLEQLEEQIEEDDEN